MVVAPFKKNELKANPAQTLFKTKQCDICEVNLISNLVRVFFVLSAYKSTHPTQKSPKTNEKKNTLVMQWKYSGSVEVKKPNIQ